MSEVIGNSCCGSVKTAFLGVLAIIMGILAMLAPGITGYSIVMLVGILVTLTGVVRLVWAFQVGSIGRGLLMFIVGSLTLLCGIAMLANPLFASGLFSILLAAYFFTDGVFELITGIMLRPMNGWGWLLFGGVVSLMLGVMIVQQFPLSGMWAIGILFGIKMFLIGLIMVAGPSVNR